MCMRFVCSTKLWYYCIFCFKTDVVSYYVLKDQSGYKIEFEKKTKNTPLTSSTNQTNQSIEPTNKETPLLFFSYTIDPGVFNSTYFYFIRIV